ncbi:hypothetical protein ACFL2T_02020 [Elusimicrobiota bacterium]
MGPLIDNALSFIQRGIKENWDSSLSEGERAKYSTIHLYEGIELLLKSALLKEHWFLVVDGKTKRTTRRKFDDGDFVSVAGEELMRRLHDVCGMTIPESARSAFDALRQLRNQFVHFHCGTPTASVIAHHQRAWQALLTLRDRPLLSHLSFANKRTLEEIESELSKQVAYLNERLDKAKPLIDQKRQSHTVLICPWCRKESLVLDQKKVEKQNRDDTKTMACVPELHCLVCEQKMRPIAVTTAWMQFFVPKKPGAIRGPHLCGNCYANNVVPLGLSSTKHGDDDHVCLSCGNWWSAAKDQKPCPECGTLLFGQVSSCGCDADSGWEYADEHDLANREDFDENAPEEDDLGGAFY